MPTITDDVLTLDEFGFVKIPEKESYDVDEWYNLKLCTTEKDLTFDDNGELVAILKFRTLKDNFLSGDDYALITAFQLAMAFRVYPPLWVLDGINTKLTKWDDSNLKGSDRRLDEIFNFGGKVAFKDRALQPIYDEMFFRYYNLKRYWALNDDDCFDVIAESLDWAKVTGADMLQHKKPKISARFVKDLHKRFNWRERYKWVLDTLPDKNVCTDEWVCEYLSRFPESAQTTIRAQAKRNPTLPRKNKTKTA